jgi:pimeloyl-ACP methyl ester carboxylesterase
MWRYVMPRLVDKRYTVLAPDLRGLGDTAKGYHKVTVAKDIRALVSKLGLVTYAYAAQHPEEVSRLAILDVPLPASRFGTTSYAPSAHGISASMTCAICPRC